MFLQAMKTMKRKSTEWEIIFVIHISDKVISKMYKELSTKELMVSNCGGWEDFYESLEQQGDQTSQSYRKSTLNIHWKGWCWSWSSNTLAICCIDLGGKAWCWERLRAGRERGNRGWDGWMASRTQWTWVLAKPRRWCRTGNPGVLQSMGSQRVRHDWVIEQQHEESKITK